MWIDDYFTYSGKYLGHDDASSDLVRLIFQEKWDENKFMNSEGEEMISHSVGDELSEKYSDVFLTDNANLRIYDHYNFTGLPLKINNNNKNGGMTFHIGNGEFVSIHIKVEQNRNLKTSDYANNIINMFVHENQHYEDYKQFGYLFYDKMDRKVKERRAINAQVYHESYLKTTDACQRSVMKYMEKIIMCCL